MLEKALALFGPQKEKLVVDPQQFEGDRSFQVWIADGLAKDTLGDLVDVMIRFRIAKNSNDAVSQLAEVSRSNPIGKLVLASGDIAGTHHTKQLLNLKKELGGQVNHDYELLRRFGVFGHSAIQKLWSGAFPGGIIESQASADASQKVLFEGGLSLKEHGSPYGNAFATGSAGTEKFLRNLNVCWQILTWCISSDDWTENYRRIPMREVLRLKELLRLLFGPSLDALRPYEEGDAYHRYLTVLTLMTWASAALHIARTGRRAILSEVPILPRYYGFGGYRLDLLVVTAIDGHPPTFEQMKIISALAEKAHSSAIHAIQDLRSFFGQNIEVRIDELKFAVGDGLDRRHIIRAEEVSNEPLKTHHTQVQRYITLLNFGHALMRGHKKAWRRMIVRGAELLYFFPESLPRVHRISMKGTDQEILFKGEFAAKLKLAEMHSVIRNRNNVLIGHVIRALRAHKAERPFGIIGPMAARKQLLLHDDGHHAHLMGFIEKHRTFLDERGCIEVVGGENGYQLHVDRLCAAIEKGEINTRSFGERGGFISCIMPKHEDSGPSMMVYLTRGYAKCYACGAYIPFARGSYPSALIEKRTRITRKSKAPGSRFSFSDLEVPDAHFKVMQAAQAILQASFWGSRAETYLKNERYLDPDLAYRYGAGYGLERSFVHLLDEFGYDVLAQYGFIGFSSNITIDQGLFPLLKRRGMALEEVIRTKKERGKMVEKLPYFVLKNRVTFPLAFPGNKITNFYARSVERLSEKHKHLKHRKLSIEGTGVPHGMFNPDVLTSSAATVLMTEGVMDALTLIQVCHFYNIIAVIGTRNYFILDSVVRSGKEMAIALDNDKAGMSAAAETMEWLRDNGMGAKAYNYTTAFIEKHPDAAPYDDYNTWWMNRQKTNKGRSLL